MFDTVLVLAPHTDDGEFGCGGTIAKLVDEGKCVYYVAFSAAERSVPAEYPSDVLRKEVKQATSILGISPGNLEISDFVTREFPQARQEILDKMIEIRERTKPDLVFLPSSFDIHQDHHTIFSEGLRAFKSTSILGYEAPWNNLVFETKCFVYLKSEHLDRKISAMKCYKSQAFRNYASEDFLKSLARTRGTQIGVKYAETFEVIRWVLR